MAFRVTQAVNPDLIYVSISGFGQTGPYAGRPAYDAVLQPMLGFPVMQGEANGQGSPPQLINGYQVDKLTSWNTVQAVLAGAKENAPFFGRPLLGFSSSNTMTGSGQTNVRKPPLKKPVAFLLIALFARATGKSQGGQHVEIAMLDVGANFFWPDGMALTGEMLVDKDPDTLSGSR